MTLLFKYFAVRRRHRVPEGLATSPISIKLARHAALPTITLQFRPATYCLPSGAFAANSHLFPA